MRVESTNSAWPFARPVTTYDAPARSGDAAAPKSTRRLPSSACRTSTRDDVPVTRLSIVVSETKPETDTLAAEAAGAAGVPDFST
jgi:hypothetical protein